jgi:hypothetical protein
VKGGPGYAVYPFGSFTANNNVSGSNAQSSLKRAYMMTYEESRGRKGYSYLKGADEFKEALKTWTKWNKGKIQGRLSLVKSESPAVQNEEGSVAQGKEEDVIHDVRFICFPRLLCELT